MHVASNRHSANSSLKFQVSSLFLTGIWILGFGIWNLSFAQPDTLWTREFDSGGDDYATSVLQTDDGGFALASSSWHENSIDFQLIHTDANGNDLWTRNYGTAQDDWCSSMIPVSGGGWLLAGYTFPPSSFFPNIFLARVNDSGDTLWTRIIGEPNVSQTANSIVQQPGGGFLIVGIKDVTQQGQLDIFLLSVNENGDTLWTRTYVRAGIEDGTNLTALSDGNYLITGSIQNEVTGTDFYFMKITPSGDTLWTRSYGGEGFDLVVETRPVPDGGAVFAGLTDSFGEHGDHYLARINSSGDTLWSRTFGGDDEDHAHTLALASDGGYLLAGHTDSFESVNGDLYLIKTDSDGIMQWIFTQPGPDYESFESLEQTSDGGVILAINHIPIGLSSNVVLMRLDNIESVSDFIPQPSSFTLSSYPNPFNATATISFTLPQADRIQLDVFDINGRAITTLANEHFSAGEHRVSLDASLWPSGIYLCHLQTSHTTLTCKLLLLK